MVIAVLLVSGKHSNVKHICIVCSDQQKDLTQILASVNGTEYLSEPLINQSSVCQRHSALLVFRWTSRTSLQSLREHTALTACGKLASPPSPSPSTGATGC